MKATTIIAGAAWAVKGETGTTMKVTITTAGAAGVVRERMVATLTTTINAAKGRKGRGRRITNLTAVTSVMQQGVCVYFLMVHLTQRQHRLCQIFLPLRQQNEVSR
jgi:hypothetical protein